jgi:RNA polymerase sigma-70 factor (sigma-E family)
LYMNYLEVVSGTRRTSKQTMANLYQTHAGAAVRLAYVLTGDHDLAEDLMQEAFVRVFGRFAERRDPHAFDRYLRMTIINLARTHWRRRATERAHLQEEPHSTSAISPDLVEREAIWSALLTLPKRQRAALFLRYYEDLSEAEVAAALDCSVAAARSLLLRARRTLETLVRDFAND